MKPPSAHRALRVTHNRAPHNHASRVANDRALRVADDFGLGRGHDRVILTLMEAGHIDAASVMIDGAIAPGDLARLIALRKAGAQIGLHLNLTHRFHPDSVAYPLGRLMRMALAHRLPPAARTEFQRQARLFRNVMGFWPDYYDGHQHCHCLPGLAAIAARLPQGEGDRRAWMRVPLPKGAGGLWRGVRAGGVKVLILAGFALAARRHLRATHWYINEDFAGFLRLDRPDQVALWLPVTLAQARPGMVLMLHPGAGDDPAICPGHAPESRAIEARILGQS